MTAERPRPTEYDGFYSTYVDAVPPGPILGILRRQLEETLALWRRFGESRANHRYAPEKWSVREVAGHVVDVERLFSYRALAFARSDPSPIPGMDQDEWMAASGFESRRLESIAEEFRHLRLSNIELFNSFDDETLMRRGTASGLEFTVRAMLWIIAGHERHHRLVLEDRYT